ncbi:MAG: RNA 2'-phosphotransferase [Erythrobacter sp.]|uniref:RNA 2'-phosphotransferase n=1 Tax=Erythrobacter sp. TaxID=1042 RepID=UPI003266C9A1
MSDILRKRSKALSYWLRHAPEKGGIVLDAEGWAEVSSALRALAENRLETDVALLARVVEENDKKRFELSPDRLRIRAWQGHSIAVEGAWERTDPPEALYHGTVEKFMESIEAEGLTKRNRHHVHLSLDLETASKVGQRRGKPVILQVDTTAMVADGFKFYLSANGVWLVDAVPTRFFKRL